MLECTHSTRGMVIQGVVAGRQLTRLLEHSIGTATMKLDLETPAITELLAIAALPLGVQSTNGSIGTVQSAAVHRVSCVEAFLSPGIATLLRLANAAIK